MFDERKAEGVLRAGYTLTTHMLQSREPPWKVVDEHIMWRGGRGIEEGWPARARLDRYLYLHEPVQTSVLCTGSNYTTPRPALRRIAKGVTSSLPNLFQSCAVY